MTPQAITLIFSKLSDTGGRGRLLNNMEQERFFLLCYSFNGGNGHIPFSLPPGATMPPIWHFEDELGLGKMAVTNIIPLTKEDYRSFRAKRPEQ